MSLPDTIRAAIERHTLIPPDTPVVVGVSGGADSTALLHAFKELGVPCTAAHLNHGLRGNDSDADERFVQETAQQLDIPFVSQTVNVAELAEKTGESIEMAARQARHDYFETFESAVIALGHHADDQIETFFLKLARGAGPDGLSGMTPQQKLGNLHIIRPMLEIPRSEIMHWLTDQHLEWREDASNTDTVFLRNRVRHNILPLLENELNPGIRQSILRTMDILREENAYVDAASSHIALNTTTSDTTRLEAASTLKQPLALQRRIVRNWLIGHGMENTGFEVVDNILGQMQRGEGTTVIELNAHQRVVIEYGEPRFEQVKLHETQPDFEVTITRGTGWKADSTNKIGQLPAEASFNCEKVAGATISARCFHPGDRMNPFGMDGSRKLQDIFTDHKVPKAARSQIPVVTCRDEIIWLPGYRIARGWEVSDQAAFSVHVRIEQKVKT